MQMKLDAKWRLFSSVTDVRRSLTCFKLTELCINGSYTQRRSTGGSYEPNYSRERKLLPFHTLLLLMIEQKNKQKKTNTK